MTASIQLAQVSFPEIHLSPRDAHKLRGYFGNVFKEHSPLLHNHFDDGRLRYLTPLVQYKVVGGTPVLVGIEEGAKLLAELFFKINTLDLEGRKYPVLERDIAFKNVEIGVGDGLQDYRFRTLWVPLNQRNYPEYLTKSPDERRTFLGRIMVGNILSFFKGVGFFVPEGMRLLATVRPEEERQTNFKDTRLLAFSGGFTTNALLPDWVGLGKSVARGFGTIERVG